MNRKPPVETKKGDVVFVSGMSLQSLNGNFENENNDGVVVVLSDGFVHSQYTRYFCWILMTHSGKLKMKFYRADAATTDCVEWHL